MSEWDMPYTGEEAMEAISGMRLADISAIETATKTGIRDILAYWYVSEFKDEISFSQYAFAFARLPHPPAR